MREALLPAGNVQLGDVAAGDFELRNTADFSTSTLASSPLVQVAALSTEEGEQLAVGEESYQRSDFPWLQRRLGTILSTAAGRPSWLYRMIQAQIAATAVCFVPACATAIPPVAEMKDGPNGLLYMSLFLLMMVYWCSLLTLESAREALRPRGPLDQLKAGVRRVKRSQIKTTLCWTRAGIGFSGFVVVVCVVMLSVAVSGTNIAWEIRGIAILCSVSGILVIPIIFCGWWPSMYTASMLCRESITCVTKNVETFDPASESGETWHNEVAEPALALRAEIDLLSNGWSLGLFGLGGCFSFAGAGWFTLAVNSIYCRGLADHYGIPWSAHYYFCLGTAAVCPFLALLLALDLASTSDCVLELMEQLNLLAIKLGPRSHEQINWLEMRLKRLVRNTIMHVKFLK
eukprot:COSAG02_NODE_331_length_24480_cov_22.114720_17_plen_402_part_00